MTEGCRSYLCVIAQLESSTCLVPKKYSSESEHVTLMNLRFPEGSIIQLCRCNSLAPAPRGMRHPFPFRVPIMLDVCSPPPPPSPSLPCPFSPAPAPNSLTHTYTHLVWCHHKVDIPRLLQPLHHFRCGLERCNDNETKLVMGEGVAGNDHADCSSSSSSRGNSNSSSNSGSSNSSV
jgi:hypothetical protein